MPSLEDAVKEAAKAIIRMASVSPADDVVEALRNAVKI